MFGFTVALSMRSITQAEIISAGNIVAVQQSSGRVYIVDPLTGTSSIIATGLGDGLSHVRFDQHGKIVTTTRSPTGVLRIDPSSGQVETLASGSMLLNSFALAFENSNSLLVADLDSGLVRIDLTSGNQELVTPFNAIQDIEIGIDGTIYALDFGVWGQGGGTVRTINPFTGTVSQLTSDGAMFNPADMAFDSTGNLLVSNGTIDNTSEIVRIDTHSGASTVLFPFDWSGFISLESSDYLLIANFGSNQIHRAEIATGQLSLLSELGVYGNLTGIAVAVPEPSSFSACLIILLILGNRSRFSRRAVA